ncbi:MarR family transcriptional regulator [Zhengella mangrovi]|uniref:MarR family transcriptional regulator n=1 Tax=Zhengella mangrovi TaxID=1982044 RepID=A0A2G1QMM9_9HYPH|nr:MarR family transcriptional regulator [Zhengella mangrovi]PHP66797.1 MarR family transcriptional regulator [Zhengella mangrovi]
MKSFDLADYLPYRLAALSERISRRLALEYGQSHGLSMAEWRVLVHLSRHSEVSVGEICTYVNLEKPRVSRAVARLESAGLVNKYNAKDDHRLVAISLTDKGTDALKEIIAAALAYEKRLTAALTPKDMERLLEIAEKLHGVLDKDPLSMPRPEIDRN